MGIGRGNRGPRAKRQGLLGLRSEIDNRVINMILDTLTPHQRELLRATVGNPNIDKHLLHLIEALLAADAILGSSDFEHSLTEFKSGNKVRVGDEVDES